MFAMCISCLQRDKVAYNLWRKEVQRHGGDDTGAAAEGSSGTPGSGPGLSGGRQRKRKDTSSAVEPPRRLLRSVRPEDEFAWEATAEANPDAQLPGYEAGGDPASGGVGEGEEAVNGVGGEAAKLETKGNKGGGASNFDVGGKEELEDGGGGEDGAQVRKQRGAGCVRLIRA